MNNFQLCRTTITTYLKQGTKLGICNYVPRKNTKVYVKEIDKIFDSKNKCSKELGIWYHKIDDILDKNIQYKGYTFETYKEDSE